ncbi:endonuclease III [Desulfuromonas versatilis]|uniref:Endonuclease III n=1 Tax=Desulfuromonas versatilis TaxID=2802975 RepID=A0ABN6DTY0_9BACT|nr:endonuclease III domain-containing protein [Desulfuromonas versatilis]BCR03586.1 endonuclease III [Desulfuromonas versatilis]
MSQQVVVKKTPEFSESPDIFREVFERLAAHFGPLHWWPAETPFEVLVGAVLTQNTAWTNVEKAIANLKQAGALGPAELRGFARAQLEELIRPAGFFRQKAERLQLALEHLFEYHRGSLERLLAQPLETARRELLSLKGIGPETADSILLYAGSHPSFVVDAYTRRLFERLGVLSGAESYEAIRSRFMTRLPHDSDLFNEYHALIVEQCKTLCRKRAPRCRPCPLLEVCPFGQQSLAEAHSP